MTRVPFHKRLVFRLAAGMLTVALISLLVVFTIQAISFLALDLEPRNIFLRRFQMLFSDASSMAPLNSEGSVLSEGLTNEGLANEELANEGPANEGARGVGPRGEGFQNRFRIRQILQLSSLVGFITSGILWTIFAIRFSKSIAKPIEQVTQAAAEITEGDLSTRVEIPKNTVGESEQLLQHFNQMASSLENYEQERTEMIASIAHELRTPLAVTRSRLELMQDGIVELNQDEVSRLIRQMDLLNRLVGDLRTLSLADAGELSLNKSSVQFDELVRDVVATFEARAFEKNIGIELTLEAIHLNADIDRLSQVIYNLVDNAIKLTPDNGTIQLSLNKSNGYAKFSIQDSGNGFEGDAEELFKRFYTTKQSDGSSGIGLSVVKTIVESHGGSIEAVNGVDGGAIFKVLLPET